MCHSFSDGDKFDKIFKKQSIQHDTWKTNEAFIEEKKHVEMEGHWGAKILTEIVLIKLSRSKFDLTKS